MSILQYFVNSTDNPPLGLVKPIFLMMKTPSSRLATPILLIKFQFTLVISACFPMFFFENMWVKSPMFLATTSVGTFVQRWSFYGIRRSKVDAGSFWSGFPR